MVGEIGTSHIKAATNGIKSLTELFGSISLYDLPKITKDIPIKDIDDLKEPAESVSIQARLENFRIQKNNAFLVLRNEHHQTIQGIIWKNKPLVEYVDKVLKKESVIVAHGNLVSAFQPVKSCTVQNLELQISKLYCVGANHVAQDEKQMNYQDFLHTEAEENTLAPSLSKKLDNRVLDLRTPVNHAVFKTVSRITNFMRSYLIEKDFTEVFLPKIIGASSEGGSEFFKLKYFDTEAYLAQSPQLYKQMMICADFGRVFSVGPVFRAENSNTHRHLCEFTGFDLEMSFKNHYHEVVRVIDAMFLNLFENLFSKCKEDIEKIEEFFGVQTKFKWQPVTKIFHYREAIQMLNEAGIEIGPFDDINTTNEKLLGKIIREKYDTDYYIIDKFPVANRAFYSMPDTDEVGSGYGNSYDFFLRGEEIMSGAQRVTDSELLKKIIEERGMDATPLKSYIDAIGLGVAPHAGGGIGLERVAMFVLGLGNIRRSTLFPRDPSRLEP